MQKAIREAAKRNDMGSAKVCFLALFFCDLVICLFSIDLLLLVPVIFFNFSIFWVVSGLRNVCQGDHHLKCVS